MNTIHIFIGRWQRAIRELEVDGYTVHQNSGLCATVTDEAGALVAILTTDSKFAALAAAEPPYQDGDTEEATKKLPAQLITDTAEAYQAEHNIDIQGE